MIYFKDFLSWIKVKKDIDSQILNSDKKEKFSEEIIRKSEIRWAILGVNIG